MDPSSAVALAIAGLALIGTILTLITGSQKDRLARDDAEWIRIESKIEALENKIDSMRVHALRQDDYIFMLRQWIGDRRSPPPPPWPEAAGGPPPAPPAP